MFSLTLQAGLHALLFTAPLIGTFDSLTPLPLAPSDEADFSRKLEISQAGGESEFFHILVWNDGTGRTLEACELVWDGEFTTPVRIYTTGDTGGNAARDTNLDNRLSPFTPVHLNPGDTLHLIAEIYVAPDRPPGRYTAQLRLNFNNGETIERPIRVEVFGFALPSQPSIPTFFGIDRAAFKMEFGLGPELTDWAATYDALSELRVGFQVWPEKSTAGEIFYDDRNVDLVKAHLDYVVRAAGLPVVGIGGQPGELLEKWPPPAFNSPQDPLQLLFHSIWGSLERSGWGRRTLFFPMALPARDTWQAVRMAYARVARADGRVTRVLAAPAHPFFERYTDIWALPPATPRLALSLLREGHSLIQFPLPDFASRTGSPGANDPSGTYRTEAGDAFDGSEVTVWHPDDTAGTPWLEAVFHSHEPLEHVTVLWPPGVEPVLPTVETAYNPGSYSVASMDWKEGFGRSGGGGQISHGTLRHARDSISLRLTFDTAPGAFSVADVLINTDERTTIDNPGHGAVPWLDLRTDDSTFDLKNGGVSVRGIPRFCWQRGFEGILAPVLQPAGVSALSVTPSALGTAPTIAMLHFRDGLEDIDYLQRYWNTVRADRVDPPNDFVPGNLPVATGPNGKLSEQSRELLRNERLRMGRLLTNDPNTWFSLGLE